uniref:RNA-directed DNA polymerase n=1 Tax=Graphocephala atropunctata TaxID=36148 RepID=A0A1B6L0V9_9HEMI
MKIINYDSTNRYVLGLGLKMSFLGNIKEFDESDDIELYLERLHQYFKANSVKDDAKAPILLTLIGPKPYGVLRNLVSPKTVDSLDFDTIVKELKSHYAPKKLVISERFKFYKRDQLPSESISNYVVELKQLASQCNFNSFLEEALRDRLVCGVNNEAIQRKLLTEHSLTFTKAVELAVSMELASNELKSFHSDSSASNVNKVSQRKVERKCTCCGEVNHGWVNCKYKNYSCNVCKKKGHLAKICRKKNVSYNFSSHDNGNKPRGRSSSRTRFKHSQGKNRKNVNQVNFENSEVGLSEGTQNLSLYKVDTVNTLSQPFQVKVVIEGKLVSAEIDTGAGRTVMAQSVFSKLFPNFYLCKSNVRLNTYMKEPIQVAGEAIVNVSLPDKLECNRPKGKTLSLLVIKSVEKLPTLIGRDWIKSLGLDLNSVKSYNDSETILSNELVKENPASKSKVECRLKPESDVSVIEPNLIEVGKVVMKLKTKYPDVFKPGFGLIKNFEAKLICKPNTVPTFYKARPVPFSMKSVVKQELQKLKDNGIIEPVSHSDWASCIVVVPKPNSDQIRICGDFKNVNQCLKTEHYPLPTMEDLFQPLTNGKVFTVLDISNAFQQLKVSEDSRPFLTINTHVGLFRYTRLPFGISSAPSIYQSIMDQVLQGIPNCGCYIDDVIISAENFASCKARVELVLSRLQDYGITVNESKCKFFEPKVEYLGYIIDAEGLHPVLDKVEALKQAKSPQNVTELKAYLGLLNYYHKFIPNLSTKLEPLYRLLHSKAKFVFCKEQIDTFVNSKTWLEKYNVLSHYDDTKELVLCCDASSVGVGAVISNRDSNGNEKPIHFASRTLSKHEQNYAHIEREALAIMFGLKKFHRYLYGRSFVLQTDNKSLSIILDPSKCIPPMSAMRIQRWALLLSSYNYKVEFCKGKDIAHADYLSRAPLSNTNDPVSCEINFLSPTKCEPLSSYDIAAETKKDAMLSKILDLTLAGWPNQVDKEFEPYFKNY